MLPGVRNTIAVASGKGGVGKSTIAVNLAIALRESGARVGLMDADVYGPSLPLLTGVRGRPHAEQKRIFPQQGHGLSLMSMGFFVTENSPVIWRGPMVHGLIRQFLTDVEWGELDYLVVDMPPGTGDAALTLTQQAPLAGAVIVTTANDLSLIDARKGLKMFEKVQVPVLGIVENMAYFTPPDLPDRKYYLFGEGGGRRVAEELGVPFLGEVPIDPRVVEGGDRGRPILVHAPDSDAASAIREIAGKIARRLAVLAESTPPLADANITWVSNPSYDFARLRLAARTGGLTPDQQIRVEDGDRADRLAGGAAPHVGVEVEALERDAGFGLEEAVGDREPGEPVDEVRGRRLLGVAAVDDDPHREPQLVLGHPQLAAPHWSVRRKTSQSRPITFSSRIRSAPCATRFSNSRPKGRSPARIRRDRLGAAA